MPWNQCYAWLNVKFCVTIVKPLSRKVFDNETILQIGKRIREARGERKQADFAAEIGVSRSVLSNYEAGRRLPDSDTIEKIEEAAALPKSYIIYGETPKSVGHSEYVLYDSDEKWGVAVSLHFYERLRDNIFHLEVSYTRLWWGSVFNKLIQHFNFRISDLSSDEEVGVDIAARMVMRQIDETSEDELISTLEKIADEKVRQ